MTYEEFAEQVKEQILSFLPEKYGDAEVTIEEVTRNNDQKLQALYIKRPGDRIIPSIYLDDFYQMHQEGRELGRILSTIAQLYHEGMEEGMQWQDFQAGDYDSVKKRLYVTVQNRDNNREYLKDIVHMDIPGTDITAVMRVMCDKDKEKGNTSFMVKEYMMEAWGVAGQDIYEQALANMERLFPPQLLRLENALLDEDNSMESKGIEPYEMYVLSNDVKIHGAAAMIYPGLLQEIGEATGNSFFIIPSSIHELILLRDNGEMSAEEIQRMVIEVNRTQVRPDEVLSDEVYSYDYREQKLTMETDPARTREYIEQLTGGYGYGESMEATETEEMER